MVRTTRPIDGYWARSCLQSSIPLPSPRLMSTTATSGSWARTIASASATVAASSTTVRSSVDSKARRNPSLMSAWSSTSSIRIVIAIPLEHCFDADPAAVTRTGLDAAPQAVQNGGHARQVEATALDRPVVLDKEAGRRWINGECDPEIVCVTPFSNILCHKLRNSEQSHLALRRQS